MKNDDKIQTWKNLKAKFMTKEEKLVQLYEDLINHRYEILRDRNNETQKKN